LTPRESAITALRGRRPDGLVPHVELEFQLTAEYLGIEALRGDRLEGVTGAARQDLLKRNAEMWVDVARRLNWNIITGIHWLPFEDQCRTFEYLREISGDTYMLSAFVDATYSIPSGADMMDFALRLADHGDQVLEDAQKMVDNACPHAKALIEAGAEVIFMCADYCFNDGPFLSPSMFSIYVTPFLKQLVDALHDAGAFAVKHTDGDIMPILDQLVSTGIDGLHSLDPMAGVDIAEVRRLVGPRLCLIGNVNCAWVQAGTPDQIRESTLYCLEHGGVDNGAYIFSTSNCIFAGVPMANYEYMLQLRSDFGHPGAFA
jgi:uroporphyrinogen decarboxylase